MGCPTLATHSLRVLTRIKINVPVVINIVILIGAREDICLQLSQGTLLAAKSRICPTRLAKTSGIG